MKAIIGHHWVHEKSASDTLNSPIDHMAPKVPILTWSVTVITGIRAPVFEVLASQAMFFRIPCHTTMTLVSLIMLCSFANALPTNENQPKTFFFDGFTKGFTISRVTTDDNQVAPQQGTGYQVRFVPLISLLAGMFPSLLTRLGQFNGVNKMSTVNNRRFPLADPLHENSITAPPPQQNDEQEEEGEEEDDTEDDYIEKELIECDGHHLGLWPDRTDPQRYYKCEVDPRTAPTASCIREMVSKDTGKDMQMLEKIEVPGVKPCYLLSMLKCANGFKYQHSTKICVPDIVYASNN